ncbi:InlB B-repeat-containing protein [Anaerotruncus colihominis]|uniref:InlB B-repeat-containing protein n=1 Tax=Anaerotruncus colihominis TaxID=169435 RepID=UPI003517AA45
MKRALSLVLAVVMVFSLAITIVAADEITVTYNGNGGTLVLEGPNGVVDSGPAVAATYDSGYELAKSDAPNVTPPDGKTFLYWSETQNNGSEYTFGTALTSNLTLYAQYEGGEGVYTITFDLNYNGAPAAQTAKTDADGKVTYADPIREEYTFEGWNTSADGTGDAIDLASKVFTADATLYAQWKEAPVEPVAEVTVTFDLNYEGAPAAAQVKADKNGRVTYADPIREGYEFRGWYANANGTGDPIDLSTATFTVDTTLYAQWMETKEIPVEPAPDTGLKEGDVQVEAGKDVADEIGDATLNISVGTTSKEDVATAAAENLPDSVEVAKNTDVVVYDITLTGDGGTEITEIESGKIRITLPVPESLKDGKVGGLHFHDDSVIVLTVDVRDGKMSFTTDKFSDFAFFNIEEKAVDPDPGPGPDPDPVRPGGGGSSGSGGSGGGSRLSNKNGAATTPVKGGNNVIKAADLTNKVKKNVGDVVTSVKGQGGMSGTAYTVYSNVPSISPELLKTANDAAAQASAGSGVTVKSILCFDTVRGGQIIGRMYLNPALNTLAADIRTGITVGNASVEALFTKWFQNNIVVIDLAHQGSFGMPVEAAVKADLSASNTNTLRFYNYDASTNVYTLIENPLYFIDTNGYLHFTTTVGGPVIVTDAPLTLR